MFRWVPVGGVGVGVVYGRAVGVSVSTGGWG